MFYFGRYFMAGKDLQNREIFNARWKNPVARRAHRLITAVWGLVFVGEFVLRLILIYNLPAAVVLVVFPVALNCATILLIIWAFWYAYSIRERIKELIDADDQRVHSRKTQ
jgi:energy-coupling factor transporter transmembrane protein EcfT